MRTSRQCTLVNIERSCDIWRVIAVGVQLSTSNSSARYIYNIRFCLDVMISSMMDELRQFHNIKLTIS